MLFVPVGNSFRLGFPLCEMTEGGVVDSTGASGSVSGSGSVDLSRLQDVSVWYCRDREGVWCRLDAEWSVEHGMWESEVPAFHVSGVIYSFRLTGVVRVDGELYRQVQGNWHRALKTVNSMFLQFGFAGYCVLESRPVLAFSGEALRSENAELRRENSALQSENASLSETILGLRSHIDTLLGAGAGDSFMKVCVMDYNRAPEWLNLDLVPHDWFSSCLYLSDAGLLVLDLPAETAFGADTRWAAYILASTRDIAEPYEITRFMPFRATYTQVEVLSGCDDGKVGLVRIKSKSTHAAGRLEIQVLGAVHVYGIVCVPVM